MWHQKRGSGVVSKVLLRPSWCSVPRLVLRSAVRMCPKQQMLSEYVGSHVSDSVFARAMSRESS